jgi:2-polyprenyl-6-methoxyphenol hydroxylase-like FAD-dependent oxidoreductase
VSIATGGRVPAARSGGVIVVGAGPTGLILAAELALAGARPLVLDRRPGPRTDSRAICLHARSLEALDLRGEAGRFAGAGLAVPSFPLGPRGARIDFSVLDSDFPYLLDLPQSEIERLLLARALDLGAEVRWSATVTSVAPEDAGVRLGLADGGEADADYVVGCDGVHSFVRNEMAIPFPGIHNPGSVILADLRLDGFPMDAAYGDLSRNGMLLIFPFRDGFCRVVLYDYGLADVPVSVPVSLADVTGSLLRVSGRDFRPGDLRWSGRYQSESRQAPTYRAGRVLLAGDAAHAHSPAGAQGMNTGLQDAVNLGWKLGAAVGGWAPDWLLDSYTAERHPVGADVLALSGRQFRLNTVRSPARRLLRWAVHRLVVPLPPVQARLARDYSGISIAYPPAGSGASPAHPLAGRRLPRGAVILGDGRQVRLAEFFHGGTFVLFDRSAGRPGEAEASAGAAGSAGAAVPAGPAAGGPADRVPDRANLAAGGAGPAPGVASGGMLAGVPADRIAVVAYRATTAAGLPAAVLVRPDGYIAWASDEPDPAARAAAARAAISQWCCPGVLTSSG